MLIEPKISPYADKALIHDQDDTIIDQIFENDTLDHFIEHGDITGCRFTKMDFNRMLQHMHLSNCTFQDSNLSQLKFKNKRFYALHFQKCRMSGISLENIVLKSVLFEDCDLSFSSFIQLTFQDVRFVRCSLKDCLFYHSDLRNTVFDDVCLQQTEIDHTSFHNIDLSNCQTEALRITIDDLKGATLNTIQALDVLNQLHIRIKE